MHGSARTRRASADYTKATFPVMLGYAMTAHRAQGATLTGTTILHVREAFAPGIVYVMLSRVTTRDNLYILGSLKPEDFVPATAASFPARGEAVEADAGSDGAGHEDTSESD